MSEPWPALLRPHHAHTKHTACLQPPAGCAVRHLKRRMLCLGRACEGSRVAQYAAGAGGLSCWWAVLQVGWNPRLHLVYFFSFLSLARCLWCAELAMATIDISPRLINIRS